MEVNAQQVLEILNKRAQTEPLIQEIMRSAMFEAAYMAEQATPITSVDEQKHPGEPATDAVEA